MQDGCQAQCQEKDDSNKGANGTHGEDLCEGTTGLRPRARHESVQPRRGLFRNELSGHGTHHFFGRVNGNFQGLLSEWMKPLESRAGEVESMALVVGRLAVDQIAHHGVSQRCGVSPDLMGATGKQFPLDEARMVVNTPSSAAQGFECRLRPLAFDGQIHSTS